MTRPAFRDMSDADFQRMAGKRAHDRAASYEELRAMVVDSCRRLRQRVVEQPEHSPSEATERERLSTYGAT